MWQVLVIILFLAQALVAQAGVPGLSCMHAFANSAGQADSTAGIHAQTLQPDESPAHEPCCCDVVGHCSSTAIATASVSARAHGYPPGYSVPRITAAIATGFQSPPYRPPSPVL